MANESRAPAKVGRVAIEGGVGGGIGYVLAQFIVGFIPAGTMEAVQVERLEVLLLALFTALAPAVMTAMRNAGRGGAFTGATPLRSEIGVSSLVVVALTAALVLPGLTGCGVGKNLTPAGRFDVAMETATGVVEELSTQAAYVVEDRRLGLIDQREAERRYNAFRQAQQALNRSADIARVAFEDGNDPDALVLNLNEAIGAARAVIRREGR